MMMGLEEDPEDHAAVASSIFIAVAVYAVCATLTVHLQDLTSRRHSLSFADSKHGCMFERVDEGRFL